MPLLLNDNNKREDSATDEDEEQEIFLNWHIFTLYELIWNNNSSQD